MDEALKIPLPTTLGLSSNPLAHKINQILSTSFLDADIKAAIDALERRGPRSDDDDEQNIASDVSIQILENDMSVLNDYKRLAEAMRSTKTDMVAMRQAIAQMKTEASAVKASSSQLLVQANFLKQHRAQVHEKRRMLLAFQHKFTISDAQLMQLSSQQPVDADFFQALERVKRIHDDCHLLLATDTQTAGNDIMESMSTHLDTGYAKLHRWILRELNSTVAGAAEANVMLRRALTVLSERPTLYEQCLDHVSRSRQRVLANEFAQALTRGREGGKPILSASDDPMRFVNDVLAYLHQAVASEKEVLDVILGSATNAPTPEDQVRRESAAKLLSPPALENITFSFSDVHSTLVDRNFQLVMKPLQRHINQSVMSTQDTLIAYRSAILIRFYRDLLSRSLLPEAQVLASLKSLEQSLIHWFLQFTRTDVAAVKAALPDIDQETLAPPEFLLDALHDAAAVLDVLDSSFLDAESKQDDFTEMFDTILKQSLELCVRVAADLEQPGASIFLLHCAVRVMETLKPFGSVAQKQAEDAQELARRTRQALVVEQYEYILRRTGLGRYLEAIETCYDEAGLPLPARHAASGISQDKAEEEPDRLLAATKQTGLRRAFARLSGYFDQESFRKFEECLDECIPTLRTQLGKNLEQLQADGQSELVAEAINKEAIALFVEDYGLLESQVIEHVEFGSSLLSKSKGEIAEALDA